MKYSKSTGVAVGLGALIVSGAALGQQSGETPAASQLDEIVVTGSRIVRDGFSAPTPVTVLVADDLYKKAPSSIADGLNQLPTFLNSLNETTSGGVQSNSVRTGNFLNLRALGPQRTLVMQDSRRVAPSSNNGSTDVNLIPQMLIERVDVVTGGASAAYGSDAVSGVVNFITDTKFTGMKSLVQGGVSSRSDNESYRVGLAGGTPLMDGRLHVIGSAEMYHSEGIAKRSDRPLAGDYWVRGGVGTAASPYINYSGVKYTYMSLGGVIADGPLARQQFMPDGSLAPFNPGSPVVASGQAQNGDGVGHTPDCCNLIPESETKQMFARATFELAPAVTAYAQVAYSEGDYSDDGILFSRHLNQMTIYAENAYLSDSIRAALGSTPSFTVSRSFDEWGPNDSKMRSTGINAAAGFEGTFGDGWRWDLNYVRGDTRFRSTTHTQLYRNFYAALDAVRDPATGNIVCRVTLVNPGLLDDCVPFNSFGAGSAANAAAEEFITDDSVWSTRNVMDAYSVNLSGDAFDLWAGPLSMAVGLEYRELSLVQTSNSDPRAQSDRTGVRGATSPGNFYNPNVTPIEGEYDVREGYLELNLPVLKGLPFAQSLELNGAIRHTDYSTSGEVETWKVGLTYEPVNDIRLRGTVSRDIRAPSLTELFSGQTQSAASVSDPLTGFFGAVFVRTGGNPDLEPERATTYTGGITLTPSAVPGFSAAFDYYRIVVDDAIATPYNVTDVISLCYLSGGTSVLCGQIERPLGPGNPDPSNYPRTVTLTSQNVSSLRVAGVDFEMSYRRTLGPGDLTLRLLGTRLLSFDQQRAAGQPVQEFAGTNDYVVPLPKWRGNAEIGYNVGNFNVSVQERMIGGFDKSHIAVYQDNTMPSVFYTDVNAGYRFQVGGFDSTVFLTVNNAFDKVPPLFPATVPGLAIPTIRSLYDINGRYFTLGVRSNF